MPYVTAAQYAEQTNQRLIELTVAIAASFNGLKAGSGGITHLSAVSLQAAADMAMPLDPSGSPQPFVLVKIGDDFYMKTALGLRGLSYTDVLTTTVL